MLNHLKLAFALIVLFAATAASAQAPLRVCSVKDSRFNDSWTLDGSEMTNTRAKLLNTANFGAGGIATRAINIIDTAGTVGSVNASLLAGCDVFFIGYLDDANANAFTNAELTAMMTWTNGGGTMIITCDDTNYDATCSFFGHPADPSNSGTNPTVPTAAGAASPIFNNVFGTVTAIDEVGTQGTFTSAAGATVLAQDSATPTPHPTVLMQSFGSGRAVLMADVDLVANGLSAGAGISNQNDRFLGNLFAFAAGIAAAPRVVSTAPIPASSPEALALSALLIALLGFAALRRRSR
jgi:hypothetical protein